MINLLKRLWKHVSPRRRTQLMLLGLLTIVAAFSEVIGIGAVIPFIGVFMDPGRIYAHPLAQPLIELAGWTSPDQLLLPFTLGFCALALSAGAIRLVLLWATTRIGNLLGVDLGSSLYRITLYQPYAFHVSGHSSETIGLVTSKATQVTNGILLPGLQMMSSAVMLIVIAIAVVLVEPGAALAAIAGFGAMYIGLSWSNRKRLTLNGSRIREGQGAVVKDLQEGLGGIRDVLIDASHEVYCRSFEQSNRSLRMAQASNQFLGANPRLIVEASGMVLIAVLAFWLSTDAGADGFQTALPVLAVFALAAQRCLPLLQQIYGGWASIRGNRASFVDVVDMLEQPVPAYHAAQQGEPVPFERQLALRQVSFRYSMDSPWVLQNVNLSIARGSRVGFMGVTGSGKSTLLDIIMGLLEPSEGILELDGQPLTAKNIRGWQAHIAHVPQDVFLSDSSVAENIAIGVPSEKIDMERVRIAAQRAQISNLIEGWPEQYDTFIGERGVRLSGGQRQRIGIARALYREADVIIFDEATSALDSETERSVMQAIEALGSDLTILIIAHRLSTLHDCSTIVELGEGRVLRTGTYEEMVTEQSA